MVELTHHSSHTSHLSRRLAALAPDGTECRPYRCVPTKRAISVMSAAG